MTQRQKIVGLPEIENDWHHVRQYLIQLEYLETIAYYIGKYNIMDRFRVLRPFMGVPWGWGGS